MDGRGFWGERVLWGRICCYFQVAFSSEREMEGRGPTWAVCAVCVAAAAAAAARAAAASAAATRALCASRSMLSRLR